MSEHTCKQEGCKNSFINKDGYCWAHYLARKPIQTGIPKKLRESKRVKGLE